MNNVITKERIEQFFAGSDPMEKIVSIEVGYKEQYASLIYYDEGDVKRIREDPFMPFLWAKEKGAKRLFIDKQTGRQNRGLLKYHLDRLGIKIKKLKVHNDKGETNSKLANGYNLMFYTTKPTAYSDFLSLFRFGGVELYGEERDFMLITPVEQHMIRTGKRLFKGMEDYDELNRFVFDLETEGLDPYEHRIKQIGCYNNKGYQRLLSLDTEDIDNIDVNEILMIGEFFKIISKVKPDVIIGYNSENFDWDFIIKRIEVLGYEMKDLTSEHFRGVIYKSNRPTSLKLGGESEMFYKTKLWGYSIVDALHAVRRAQAMDSNMKLANLKYVTQYSKLNKVNRVYVKGDKIDEVWSDKINKYAFNDIDGKWYKIDEKHPLKENYEIVSGKYIVTRYLEDDLYETDKVELMYNQTNFLTCKLLPTTFERTTTMGTAGIWKLIMMAWSFEHNLAIPEYGKAERFTGGLSRLLEVGYSKDVLKLDFNSLYPSIIITWAIESETDLMGVMLSLLEYILTTREESKYMAKKYNNDYKRNLKLYEETGIEDIDKKKEIDNLQIQYKSHDNKQLQQKILANSFFGSFGAPNIFPWGDIKCAEETTCTGRQSLRLMVKWFGERGYRAIVGDSFTGDTPLFIKYNNSNLIDIKPINWIFNDKDFKTDALGREYDYSDKEYKVLARGGWIDPLYVYRHRVDKDMYRVIDEESSMIVDVTEDHSLYDNNQNKITPTSINSNTELEYYKGKIDYKYISNLSEKYYYNTGKDLGLGTIDVVPMTVLNTNINNKKLFFKEFMRYNDGKELNVENRSKVCLAGLLFIKDEIENYE